MGYKKTSDIVEEKSFLTRNVLVTKDNITLELIEPIDARSPVYSLLGKGLYHLAYKCEDIYECIGNLRNIHCILFDGPLKSKLHKTNIAFMYTPDAYIIELIEGKEV